MTDPGLDSRTDAGATTRLRVRDLGRLPYGDALALQRSVQRAVIEGRDPGDPAVGELLLVEHDPPVITISGRRGAATHLTATAEQLAAAGVDVARTDRGGDITYHGPGQLVVYPIIDLNRLGLRLHDYMRLLEQIVIEVLATWGLRGRRDPDATGVWISGDAGDAKICAMGVRVSRWVTMHGLAINVTTDLSHFDLIVPCGLVGRKVTSMERELGESSPGMTEVKAAVVGAFERAVVERCPG